MLKKVFKFIFETLEKHLPFFLTFHTRPKCAAGIKLQADMAGGLPRIAIVIQGPVLKDQDFTLETIRLYKKIFPFATLILSTWQTESADYLQKIIDIGCRVITSASPSEHGGGNINFQIISSIAGIKAAAAIEAEYVFKTRTDQRLYEPNSLEFLYNCLNYFTLPPGFKQKKRIIGLSLNSFKYRLYGLSDMNLFGTIHDMLLYWDVALDKDRSRFKDLPLALPEISLVTEFLQKVGHQPQWTIPDSWQALANHFCVVDEHSVNLYWYKYARMKEYRYQHYNAMRNDQPLSFREWFDLYVGFNNKISAATQMMQKVIA